MPPIVIAIDAIASSGDLAVPGKNRLLKSNELLFAAGDASDGMYLVRKGTLRVFLKDEDREVSLAQISEGQLIGEMALFDHKPRSACVKADQESEVTHISQEDFEKLVKQVPKWFVSLMTTLSTRLRVTNERLQKLETGRSKGEAFLAVTRVLHVLNLLWAKDGVKEGKDWQLEKDKTLATLSTVFGENPKQLERTIKILIKNTLIEEKFNSYRAAVYSLKNKGVMELFVEYFTKYVKANVDHPYLDESAIQMLQLAAEISKSAAYEKSVVTFEDLEKAGRKAGAPVDKWKNSLPLLKTVGDGVQLMKTGTGGLGLRVDKKEIITLLQYHSAIADLFGSGNF